MSQHPRFMKALLIAAVALIGLLFGPNHVAHAAGTVLRIELARAGGGTRVPVVASLTSDTGQPASDGRIVFYVDGERDGEARTDSQGRAEWRIRRALDAGSHTIEAAFDDSDPPLRVASHFMVAAPLLQLQLPQRARVGEPLNLSAQLTTPAGDPVDNATVSFVVNGQPEGRARTNAGGQAVWRIRSSLPAGAYAVEVVYDGQLPLLPTRASASLAVEPAILEVRTVPALPGMPFSLAGQVFKAGSDGIARVSVDHEGVYSLTVPLATSIQPAERREFAGWGDGIYAPERNVKIPAKTPLEAGFNLQYLVTPEFTHADDASVDPQRISSLTLTSSIGRRETLESVGPSWLQGSSVVDGPEGLEERNISYAVESVVVDGANVVSQSRQRFVPGSGGQWSIPVSFFSAQFRARDALFGFPAGSGLKLTYPDGHTQGFALGRDGQVSIGDLARGEYRVQLVGRGLAPVQPLVLARSQDVPILLVSYLDLGVISGFLALFALGLLLLGRGWMVRLRRRDRSRLPASSPVTQEGETTLLTEEQC